MNKSSLFKKSGLYHFKIILIFMLTVNYFFVTFNSIEKIDTIFFQKNLSEKNPICILGKSSVSDFSINLSTNNKIIFDKVVKVRLNATEPIQKSSIFTKVKTFRQNKDIHFNFPLVCFKFSLREYTEGS